MEIIKLNVGKNSIISLPSLAMSGYLWSFKVDRKEVISVTEDQNNTLPDDLKFGESLPKRFRIQALKPGTAKLIFSQKRSWEKDTTAISNLIFTVVVS